MMKNHQRASAFFLAFFLCLPLWAARFTGVVQKNEQNELLLALPNGQDPLVLSSGSDSVLKQLNRLDSGDFVSLYGLQTDRDGLRVADGGHVSVTWIEFVGLRELIGLWTNESNEHVFEFRTFSDMNHYRFDFDQAYKRTFMYNIAPASGSLWKVFLSDDNSVTIGSILFRGDASAALLLYDQDSVVENQVFELEKVTPHYFQSLKAASAQ